MEQPLVRGLLAVAAVAFIVAVAALAMGYLVLAPMGFLAFVLALIVAVVLATTPPIPRAKAEGGAEPEN